MIDFCCFCDGNHTDTRIDRYTALGIKRHPGIHARDFDLRYGFPCHQRCLIQHLKTKQKQAKKSTYNAWTIEETDNAEDQICE